MGVAPYVGINFAAYEALRGLITPPGKNGVARKLTCGALAGRQCHVSMDSQLTFICPDDKRIDITDAYVSI